MKLLPLQTPSAINKMSLAKARSAYSDLADQMDRIERGEIVRCPVCGEFLDNTKFYVRNSFALGVFPICKECLLNMATDYDPRTKTRTDNRKKTIAVFSMIDLPFHEEMYKKCVENVKAGNCQRGKTAYQQLMSSVASLPQLQNQSFADSIFTADDDGYMFDTNRRARKEIKKLFGLGFSEMDYLYLQDQYDDWRARTQVDSKSQETYVMQICLQLLDIDKDRKAGKDVTSKLKTLDTLMNSAKLQPKQNVNNAATDSLTMGQMIEKFENERPIPEPDPEFRDVNRIGKYIRVWFSGWLAKAMGFKNANTKECEDYIKQYQVENPSQVQDEESEEIYSTLFGKEEG